MISKNEFLAERFAREAGLVGASAENWGFLETLRWRQLASTLVEDPVPHASDRRGEHDVLAALVIAEVLKKVIGSDAGTISETLREKKIEVKASQVADYLRGRYTPQWTIIGRVAQLPELSEIQQLTEWPWGLLTPRDLSLKEIEEICAPRDTTKFKLPNDKESSFNRRGRSRWHCPRRFTARDPYLEEPDKPETFWLRLARFRAALTLNDHHSANSHFWDVIRALPSAVTHEMVLPHRERLYACLRILTRRLDPQFVWFSVNWTNVRSCIDKKNLSFVSVFENVFLGTNPNEGCDYAVREDGKKFDWSSDGRVRSERLHARTPQPVSPRVRQLLDIDTRADNDKLSTL